MSKSEKWLTVILLFIWLIRLPFLHEIPIFGDEANHLMLADYLLNRSIAIKDFVYGGIFPGLIIALSGLRQVFIDNLNPLLVGRAFSFGCTLLTVYLIYLTAQKLFNIVAAWFSATVYLILPINLLHGQLVMLEPLMTMLFVLCLYFCLKLTENFWWVMAVGIFLYLAITTKLLVVVSLPALLTLPLVIFSKRRLAKPLLLVGGVVLAVIVVVYPLLLWSSSHFLADYLSGGTNMFLTNLKLNLWRTYIWIPAYYSWLVIVLTASVGFFGLKERSVKILWLFGWAITVIFLDSLVGGKLFYPRHLFPLSAPLSLLMGIGLSRLWKLKTALAKVVVMVIVALLSYRAVPYYINQSSSYLVAEDRHQFYEDWVSGVGLENLAVDLKFLIQNDNQSQIYIGDEALLTWALPNVYDVDQDHLVILEDYFGGAGNLETRIKRSKNHYLVLNREPSLPIGFFAELVKTYPKGPNRELVLYRLSDNR